MAAEPDVTGSKRRCAVCHASYTAGERFCPLDGGAIVDEVGSDGPLIGKTIDGRYLIKRLLGRGGMGEVYLADHVGLDKQVAIKFLPDEGAEADLRARFRQEARAASRVEHEHVVRIYDVGTDQGRDFIAMEFIAGKDLRALLADGKLPAARAIEIGRQVLRGLHAIHEAGIVHRDIKPANIVLTKRTPDFVKIMDFGIAKLTQRTMGQTDTGTGRVLGTPQFMAPEQLVDGEVDRRADLYAVGVTLYELVSGQLPFGGTTTQELAKILETAPPGLDNLVPGLPPMFVAAIERALAKRADDRFPDALAFERALAEIPVTGETAAAETSRTGPRTPGPDATVRVRTGGSRDERPTIDEGPAPSSPPGSRRPSQELAPRSRDDAAVLPDRDSALRIEPSRRARWPLIATSIAMVAGLTIGIVVMRNTATTPAAPPAAQPVAVAATSDAATATELDPLAVARAAEARGELALAAAAYDEASRASPTPELLYRVGELYERIGERAKARAAYERYLDAAPTAPDREHVRTRIAQLEHPTASDAGVADAPRSPRPNAKVPTVAATVAATATGSICRCAGSGADGLIHNLCNKLRKAGPRCECSSANRETLCFVRWTALDSNGNEAGEDESVYTYYCMDRTRPECTPSGKIPASCDRTYQPGTPGMPCTGWRRERSKSVEATGTFDCDFCDWNATTPYHGKDDDPCEGLSSATGERIVGKLDHCGRL